MSNRETFMRKTMVVCLGALLCCGLWGSAFPCVKIGYELLDIKAGETAVQILYAGMRFTLAGILTILFGSILAGKVLVPSMKSAGNIVVLSLLQTVAQYLCFYIGLAHTTGVKASIIEGANVFIAILVASLIFHQESLSAKKMIGSVIGFAGVVLINLNGSGLDTTVSFLGEGMILTSTLAYAVSSVLIKRYSQIENPVVLSGYQFTLGGAIMMVAGFLSGGRISNWNREAILMLVYLAMVSAVAYTLWGILLKYNPVSKVAIFGFMNPVFGVVLSAFLLGEKEQAFGIKSLLALICVSVGICIAQYQKRDGKARE